MTSAQPTDDRVDRAIEPLYTNLVSAIEHRAAQADAEDGALGRRRVEAAGDLHRRQPRDERGQLGGRCIVEHDAIDRQTLEQI